MKHEAFAKEGLVRIAEPFMKARFNAEDLATKPLPPVRVETRYGIEVKTVKEILDHLNTPTTSSSTSARIIVPSINRPLIEVPSVPYFPVARQDVPYNSRSTSASPYKRSRDNYEHEYSVGYPDPEVRRTRSFVPAIPFSADKFNVGPPNRRNSLYVDIDAPAVSYVTMTDIIITL